MSNRRSLRTQGRVVRGQCMQDPNDPLGSLVAAGVVEGGRWFFGRLLDRIQGRGEASDPLTLPLANDASAPSGNVRVAPAPSIERPSPPG